MSNPTLNILNDSLTRKLDAIYARIPKIDCRRKCQMACGVVTGEEPENARMLRQLGKEFGYQQLFGRNTRPYCEFLSGPEGDCTVYVLRPLMCRLFGVTRELPCPHGCQPERWLDHSEVMHLVWLVQEATR